jgi:hypothetical protein
LQCFHIYKKFIDEIAKACFGYLNTQSSGKNYAATLAFGGSDSFGVRIILPHAIHAKTLDAAAIGD